jgi:predicted N-formylglutamate amidohydrolase
LPIEPVPTLLGPLDPPAVTVRDFGQRRPAVVVGDHASNAVPRSLAALGLTAAVLARHVAWDIGAGALSEALAERLGLTCVLAGYSRLVVDCNRDPAGAASMLATSDGVRIPGNQSLSAADRAARLTEIFEPYQAAVTAALAAAQSPYPALIAVHSFTPVMQGRARPWHCGVLWDRDPRLPMAVLAALRAEPGLVVGDNEPYSGRDPSDYTVSRHAGARGRPHVCLEIRQDLLADARGVAEWADRLARVLAPLLDDPALYAPWGDR